MKTLNTAMTPTCMNCEADSVQKTIVSKSKSITIPCYPPQNIKVMFPWPREMNTPKNFESRKTPKGPSHLEQNYYDRGIRNTWLSSHDITQTG